MTSTTILWKRMMDACRVAAAKHGWRAAARIRRDWTEWYYRWLARKRPEYKEIDVRLHRIFHPSDFPH